MQNENVVETENVRRQLLGSLNLDGCVLALASTPEGTAQALDAYAQREEETCEGFGAAPGGVAAYLPRAGSGPLDVFRLVEEGGQPVGLLILPRAERLNEQALLIGPGSEPPGVV